MSNTLRSAVVTTPKGTNAQCAALVITDTAQGFLLRNICTVGETYTYNCWVKADAAGQMTAGGATATVGTGWKRFAATFVAAKADFSLAFGIAGVYYLWHPQLEEGNVATDWTPNPDDMARLTDLEEYAKKSEITIDEDSILALVGKTYTSKTELAASENRAAGTYATQAALAKSEQNAANTYATKEQVKTAALYYRVESTGGTCFLDGAGGDTTLTARIYRGTDEVDAAGAYGYTWYRVKDGAETVFANGKTVTVSAATVAGYGVYFVADDGGAVEEMTPLAAPVIRLETVEAVPEKLAAPVIRLEIVTEKATKLEPPMIELVEESNQLEAPVIELVEEG